MKDIVAFVVFCASLFATGSITQAQTTTFNYTGSVQTYTVPAGVGAISVDVQGAQGGGEACYSTYQSVGGCGGRVQAIISVTPGQVLSILVGQRPNATGPGPVSPGGYNGGGANLDWAASWPGAGGGGASTIRDSVTSTDLVVAGGGGGGGGDICSGGGGDKGGAGGGITGGNGTSFSCGALAGGHGGTATSGGAACVCGGETGNPGTFGVGGSAPTTALGAGGGGGGWYGGGSGADGAGGGGGSSYTNPVYVYSVTHTQGYNGTGCTGTTGEGLVIINIFCNAGIVTGLSPLCIGDTLTAVDTVSGGVWSSSNGAIATIDTATGFITAVATGTVSIGYSIGGCTTYSTQHVITVPTVAVISGSPTVCVGSSTTLTDATAGGTWSARNGNATASGTIGVVAGVTAGMDTILYTLTNACGATSASYPITVDPLPDAGVITGASALCPGNNITLADTASGGTWSSAFTIIAAISSGGVVTGVASGSDIIKYTVTNSCGTALVRDTITVFSPDTPQICVVMIDSATGKNQVVWNQIGLHRAEQYNIYRLSSASVFVPIGSQASSIFSTFIDTGSYPLLQSYSYKMTLTDSCGNESDTALSTTHTTTHLTASIGVGGVVNLNWNVYVGKPITTQAVMRSVDAGPFTSIASVANTVISYTDPTPPTGALQYAIADITPTGCDPTARIMSFSYDSIVSNPVTLTTTGIAETSLEENISVFPNPATNDVNIASSLPIHHVVISNMIGRNVYSGDYNARNATISVGSLPAGVYILRVNNHVFRLVKE